MQAQIDEMRVKIGEVEEVLKCMKMRLSKMEEKIAVSAGGASESVVEACITLTFGEVAENHVGMQKIGERAKEGFNREDLGEVMRKCEEEGYDCELVDLNAALPEDVEAEDACVLIVREGAKLLCDVDALRDEQLALEWDRKYFDGRFRTVKNKRARYNLCYDKVAQKADFEAGKGTIVAFDDVSELKKARERLGELVGEKGEGLKCEGNLYYDPKNTGIGFHGDGERRKVVAIRLGASIPLHYQWFVNSEPVGERVKLQLNHGDLYIMSEKATGYDWKRRSIYTLRHAAGAKKYLTIKPKKGKAKPAKKKGPNFSRMKVGELKAYVEEKGIEVEATGKKGRILKKDYVAAVEYWEA